MATFGGAKEGALSPFVELAFALTTGDGSIPQRKDLDQPTVEELLKQRVRESQGWGKAHSAGFTGLPAGMPMVAGMVAKIAEQFTGLPVTNWLDMWNSNPVVENLDSVMQDALAAVYRVSVNLQSMFSNLDFMDPQFDSDDSLFDWAQDVLTLDGLAIPAWNLFGNPRPSLFDQISLSSIGDFSPNLATQPLFDWSGAVDDPDGKWVVDTDRFHVDPDSPETQYGNSVRVLADVVHDDLLSDPALQVTPGQRIEVTVYALWVDLVSTGELALPFQLPATFESASPVRLSVVGYDAAGVEVSDTVIASAGSNLPSWSVDHPDADDEGWVPLSATYVVPESPAVASIRVALQVTETATAGAVWFSDAVYRKTQPLEERFVRGLPEKLIGFTPDGFFDPSRLADLLEQSQIAGLLNRLSRLSADGLLDPDGLSGLLEQSQIAGLLNRLSKLSVDGLLDPAGLAGALQQSQLAIPNVQDIVDRIVEGGGGSGVGNAVDTVRDRIGGIFDVANRADQNVIDIQASVQQLVDENSSGTTGNRNSVAFSGAEGSPLTGFTVGPNFDDIVIRLDANGNAVAGLRADAPDGRYWAVFDTTQYATTDQSVSGVLGRHGSSETSLTLFCRADPTVTNGIYVNVQKDKIEVGRFTQSGSSFTFNSFVSTNRNTGIGARIELRTQGATYRVMVNGVQVLAVTTTSGNASIGTGNVSSGFVLSRTTTGVLGNTINHSFWLSSFAMADYAPEGATVPSWHLTRNAATSLALVIEHRNVAAIPNGFFTLEDQLSGATVTNLGQGVVQINTTGFYEVVASLRAKHQTSGEFGYYFIPYWVLWKNGTQRTGPIPVGVSIKHHFVAGDTVQAAVQAISTSITNSANDSSDPASEAVQISEIAGFASFSGKLVS